MPRSLHAQALAKCAVLATIDTGSRAIKQSLRSSRTTTSIRWRKVPIGCSRSARPTWTAETRPAVRMGCWQTRRHASWTRHTNTANGAAEELCGHTGATTTMTWRGVTQLEEDDTPFESDHTACLLQVSLKLICH